MTTVMNIPVPVKALNFLASWIAFTFSKRDLLYYFRNNNTRLQLIFNLLYSYYYKLNSPDPKNSDAITLAELTVGQVSLDKLVPLIMNLYTRWAVLQSRIYWVHSFRADCGWDRLYHVARLTESFPRALTSFPKLDVMLLRLYCLLRNWTWRPDCELKADWKLSIFSKAPELSMVASRLSDNYSLFSGFVQYHPYCSAARKRAGGGVK